ncbi:heparinase II/III family protein [Halomonas sp. MS1]|nr:heparinase II/III family protein [Halomonas sp. MS1]UTD55537.1 heparinase II/III family protein [Halomonas sp. MS1]
MTTNDLLACVTPGANDYIQTTINTKNKADYQKLKKLFDDQRFEAKSFEDSDLNILTFDWQSLERDRNWWWQLQALPFLNWYANSFSLQSEEERTGYLSLCLDAIHNWINQAKQNKDSPLVWHDHASAYRVRNLTNWLVFCHSNGLPLGEEPCAELLGSLIIEHLDWIQEDKHYSKHTNHGFDQAMIALTISLMFARDDFELYRQCNRARLKDEVTFAFTNEGVHKENSPGYQKMMLGRLKQLRTLSPLGEQEISQMGELYIEKAEAFLRAITLPNGYLPMIGDTRGGDEGLPYEQKEQVDVLNYSASGYVIIRGKDGKGKSFFILMKNTHESNYHRHDDDLMLYVFYDGETVFGDAGLLSHNEKDSRRVFVRSHFAHSLPYINKRGIRNRERLANRPHLSIDQYGVVNMSSSMFGEKISRSVRLFYHELLKINVTDTRVGGDSDDLFVNFIVPQANSVTSGSNRVCASFDDFCCKIECTSMLNSKVLKGWDETSNESSSISSPNYGAIVDAYRITIMSKKVVDTKVAMSLFSHV